METFGRIINIRFGNQEISCSFTSISLINHSFTYVPNQLLIYLSIHLPTYLPFVLGVYPARVGRVCQGILK